MTKITILPHHELAPEGAVIEAKKGVSLCKNLLENGINIEHACDMVCACTTCHVYVRSGLKNINPASDAEEDKLDRAWGVSADSRLSCQIIIGDDPITVEIPKYSINHAKEG